jgi:hypothetical protein
MAIANYTYPECNLIELLGIFTGVISLDYDHVLYKIALSSYVCTMYSLFDKNVSGITRKLLILTYWKMAYTYYNIRVKMLYSQYFIQSPPLSIIASHLWTVLSTNLTAYSWENDLQVNWIWRYNYLMFQIFFPWSFNFNSAHKFSMGFAYGGCESQSNTSTSFSIFHVVHRRLRCFGSLSSWRSQSSPLLPNHLWAHGNKART